jgi:hypothetical protein
MKTAFIHLAAAGLALVATTASAQVSNHLQCFKIKDTAAKAKYTADIAPTSSLFADAAGCEIKVPAKWLCIDVSTSNLGPEAPGTVSGTAGQTYLCYQTKCGGSPVNTQFSDEFGTHDVTASKTGMVCAPVGATCTDGIQNGDEAGVDCGGPCAACSGGGGGDGGVPCEKDGDCPSNLCHAGVCADADHCSNLVQDADETAADCGGSQCGSCGVGSACGLDRDCTSGVCSPSNVCTAPSCSDLHLNGDETDIDCGGSCNDCGIFDGCDVGGDCATGYCFNSSFCDYDFCHDGAKGTHESDTDCGRVCQSCAEGSTCGAGSDCSSGICNAGVCASPACSDVVAMCGGECMPCFPGGTCTQPTDCMSGSCSAGMCD